MNLGDVMFSPNKNNNLSNENKEVKMQSKDYNLSDHHSLLAKSKDLIYFTWNLLYLMKFNPKYGHFNNGFACKEETSTQYFARLDHIVAQMSQVSSENSLAFLFLQECPKEKTYCDYLLKALSSNKTFEKYDVKQGYTASSTNITSTDKVHLITLYDKEQVTFAEELTKKLLSLLTFSEGFKGRTMPLVFENKKTKKTILTVNVHADFEKEVLNDLKALIKAKEELKIDEIIIFGDFNRNLVAMDEQGSKADISSALDKKQKVFDLEVKAATQDSSWIFKNKNNQQTFVSTVVDGLISSSSMELICLENNNRPVSILSCDTLSSDLTTRTKEMQKLAAEKTSKLTLKP